MTIKYDSKREIALFETAICKTKNYNAHFVAYKTDFLGLSHNDDFDINGDSSKNAKFLNEFCFGYDNEYGQLHLLNVYITKNGTKFAATEIVMGLYAYWRIT